MTAPLVELPASLDWKLTQETVMSNPPSLDIGLVPEFPGCNPEISKVDLLWDVLELHESACRAGAYDVLNCSCGYPPCAGIEAPVFISHPDSETIIWEIDCEESATALSPTYAGLEGYIRLVFKRRDYESEVRAMLRAIRAAGRPELPVEILNPGVDGRELEKTAALDIEGDWPCKPIVAPGTRLEFGFFGTELLKINGAVDTGWPIRLFSRWEVYACFTKWLSLVMRGYALSTALGGECEGVDLSPYISDAVRNCFFLLRESERTACDQAGVEFTRMLKAAFDEDGAAPGVEVLYRPCNCPAVLG